MDKSVHEKEMLMIILYISDIVKTGTKRGEHRAPLFFHRLAQGGGVITERSTPSRAPLSIQIVDPNTKEEMRRLLHAILVEALLHRPRADTGPHGEEPGT